jgi:hypothetical protein
MYANIRLKVVWCLPFAAALLLLTGFSAAQLGGGGNEMSPAAVCLHIPCQTNDDCTGGGPTCGCTGNPPPGGYGRCDIVK